MIRTDLKARIEYGSYRYSVWSDSLRALPELGTWLTHQLNTRDCRGIRRCREYSLYIWSLFQKPLRWYLRHIWPTACPMLPGLSLHECAWKYPWRQLSQPSRGLSPLRREGGKMMSRDYAMRREKRSCLNSTPALISRFWVPLCPLLTPAQHPQYTCRFSDFSHMHHTSVSSMVTLRIMFFVTWCPDMFVCRFAGLTWISNDCGEQMTSSISAGCCKTQPDLMVERSRLEWSWFTNGRSWNLPHKPTYYPLEFLPQKDHYTIRINMQGSEGPRSCMNPLEPYPPVAAVMKCSEPGQKTGLEWIYATRDGETPRSNGQWSYIIWGRM